MAGDESTMEMGGLTKRLGELVAVAWQLKQRGRTRRFAATQFELSGSTICDGKRPET